MRGRISRPCRKGCVNRAGRGRLRGRLDALERPPRASVADRADGASRRASRRKALEHEENLNMERREIDMGGGAGPEA